MDIDLVAYDRAWIAQQSRCALCGAVGAAYGHGVLLIDEDPDLGGIRSLLCWRCMEVSRSYYRGRCEYLNAALNSGYRCDGTRPMVSYTMKIPNTGKARVRYTFKPEYVKRSFVGVDGKVHIRKGR